MYQRAVAHFEQMSDQYLEQASSLEKGHGRIDQREILTSFRIAGSLKFPYLEQVFRITRKSEQVKTGKISKQTVYGITSGSVEEFEAKDLLELTRKH